jgi:hypothetical protein
MRRDVRRNTVPVAGRPRNGCPVDPEVTWSDASLTDDRFRAPAVLRRVAAFATTCSPARTSSSPKAGPAQRAGDRQLLLQSRFRHAGAAAELVIPAPSIRPSVCRQRDRVARTVREEESDHAVARAGTNCADARVAAFVRKQQRCTGDSVAAATANGVVMSGDRRTLSQLVRLRSLLSNRVRYCWRRRRGRRRVPLAAACEEATGVLNMPAGTAIAGPRPRQSGPATALDRIEGPIAPGHR